MKADESTDTTASQRVFELAHGATGVNVSLFRYADGRETEHASACGAPVEACRQVCGTGWGRQYCRRSREEHAESAIRRGTPVPFLCHMGFSCVAAALCSEAEDSEAVAILGPFCPSEAPGSLERDAHRGFERVARSAVQSLPFSLDDIPVADADSIPAAAQWIVEFVAMDLAAGATESDSETEAAPASAATLRRRPARHRSLAPVDSVASDIATALASGDRARARTLLREAIADGRGARRSARGIGRARAMVAATSVLEAAERAGLSTQGVWEALPALVVGLRDDATADALAKTVLGTLAPLLTSGKTEPWMQHLNEVLRQGHAGGLTLNEAAEAIGVPASTLTKRLQRKFGMAFTEYLGRYRVDRAKEMLRRTKFPVPEVGRRVGFGDASNFRRLFRSFESVSPTEYREKNRA